MRWLLFALAALVALAGCIGADDPTGDDERPTEIEPQTPDRPDEGPPTHPDPDGNGSLENASEGGFSMRHVPPGDYETNLSGPSQVLEEGPYQIAEERILEAESPLDGATVQVGVVLPDVPPGEDVPVIGVATPYFYGQDLHGVDLSDHERLRRYVDNHLPHGYAVAGIPVRGTGGNGGCMTMGGHPESVDLDQAITLLGEADFSNGNVALTGISYDGWAAWEAAATGNPHLATIVPVQGMADWHEYWHPNGTSRVQGAGELNAAFWAGNGIPQYGGGPQERGGKMAQSAVCPEAARGFAAAAYSTASGERDPTGYWAERSAQAGVLANYTGSVFVVHGLEDLNVRPSVVHPWISQLHEAGIPVKQWLGQWRHTFPDYHSMWGVHEHARWDYAQTLNHWFDYWLKGNTSRDLGPPVQVENGLGEWRSAWTWPGANATWSTYYLAPDGTLANESSSSTGREPLGPDPGRTVVHNRPLQGACQTCPSFTSRAFEEDAVLSGRPRVHVTVTPTSPSPGHLSAYLYVQGEEGHRLAGWGAIDLRFADGGDEAEPVVPGEPVEVRLSLDPTEVSVQEGESLELVVSQGTEEAFGRSVERVDASSTPPTGMLLHTGDGQSTLAFQQPHPDEAAFFTPPGG